MTDERREDDHIFEEDDVEDDVRGNDDTDAEDRKKYTVNEIRTDDNTKEVDEFFDDHSQNDQEKDDKESPAEYENGTAFDGEDGNEIDETD